MLNNSSSESIPQGFYIKIVFLSKFSTYIIYTLHHNIYTSPHIHVHT